VVGDDTSIDIGGLADVATPFAVRVAATFRVADALRDGPLPADELAARCGVRADPLGRVLRHLVCRGVFEEPAPGVFATNAAARQLESGHPGGLRAWLDLDGAVGRADIAFGRLAETVRTGADAYATAFGRPFWDELGADPGLATSFGALMAAKSEFTAPAIAGARDWSDARHVVDVGGGTGRLLIELLSGNPHLRGTVVDLSAPVDETVAALEAHGVAGRCEVVRGSFFDPLPAGADLYVLSDVLGDWDDPQAEQILRRCAEAAGPAGRVLVAEMVPGEDPAGFTDMDLRMLVYVGGRMRTVDETAALADRAGLTVTGVARAADGYAVIECRPAG
jgi:SAM-dependent methyltransferase